MSSQDIREVIEQARYDQVQKWTENLDDQASLFLERYRRQNPSWFIICRMITYHPGNDVRGVRAVPPHCRLDMEIRRRVDWSRGKKSCGAYETVEASHLIFLGNFVDLTGDDDAEVVGPQLPKTPNQPTSRQCPTLIRERMFLETPVVGRDLFLNDFFDSP